MKYGLTRQQLLAVVAFAERNPKIEKIILFGSRALGTFKETSDVDIAVVGQNANFLVAADLKNSLEEDTVIPYFFDVVSYQEITNPNFKKHIDEHGIVIYQKSKKCRASSYRWFAFSALIVLLDQLTKYAASRYISSAQVAHIFPFLNFILRFNEGAAFSFLSLQNGWQVYLLSGISIVVSVGLMIWICRLSQSAWVTALSLSLILGGAIGNLVDRLRFGFVVDFVDFHVKNWHFATFNVADAAVSVGVILLVLRVCYESITRQP